MKQTETVEKKVKEKDKLLGGKKIVEETEHKIEGDLGEDVKVKKKVTKEID